MSRTRFTLIVLLAALASAPVAAGPGLLKGKPKTDAARVPALLETLKNDPDEKKRKAAATDLGRADARLVPEIVPGLVAALQKDAAVSVRLEAADAISSLDTVFPVAGIALEGAAANDSSTLVRLAAKKALWEYHLNGYRSPKGGDGIAAQTVEPPIASPAGPRPVAALVPAPPPPAPSVPRLPPTAPPVTPQLPPVSMPAGPRVTRSFLSDLFPGARTPIRSLLGAGPPPIVNATAEPPRAKPPAISIPVLPPTVPPTSPVPPPTIAFEPPPAPRVPDYVPTLPPFQPELPSVVLPPDATPMVPALPTIPKIPATLPQPK